MTDYDGGEKNVLKNSDGIFAVKKTRSIFAIPLEEKGFKDQKALLSSRFRRGFSCEKFFDVRESKTG
jgi:hypothetical protein